MNGQSFKKARLKLGLTQASLAKHLGTSSTVIRQWEHNKKTIPKEVVQKLRALTTENRSSRESSASQAVIRDPHHKAIMEALNRRLDPEVFENCAADLLRRDWPTLVPVRGGSDDGFDGAIPHVEGKPFPLISTVGGDLKANLRRNLTSAVKKAGASPKALFATSRRVTPQMRQALHSIAEQLNVNLIQIYDQDWFANVLYRDPSWSRRLLGVTGRPSALSINPLTARPFLGEHILGRDKVLQQLQTGKGDQLLIGQAAAGKTRALMYVAQMSQALFMIDTNPEALANAIREQQPQAIIADDAHADPHSLVKLRQLRTEIGANFRIIAASWPADKDNIISALHLATSDIIELEPLDANTMAEIVKSAGLRGPNELIRSIVRQSEGRPGLAVTLAYLCLRGDGYEVFAGNALLTYLSPILRNLLGTDASILLGAFGLGGDSGASMESIASFLGMTREQVSKSLARLSTAGVVRESSNKAISVWPEQLRWVLVRDTFFKGPGSLPYAALLPALPNKEDAVHALIGARSRGAHIPELEILLEDLDSPRLWRDYAGIGNRETQHVIKSHPELVLIFSDPGLYYEPASTIPLLLTGAIGDVRPLHSHTDHPLRRIQDWVLGAFPTTGETERRRCLLMDATASWLKKTGPAAIQVAIHAMCIALSPRFEVRETDPGHGTTLTLRFGLLSDDKLLQVKEHWPKVVNLVKEYKDGSWDVVLGLLHEWLYPGSQSTERIREVMKAHSLAMATDLIDAAQGHPGLQLRIIRSVERVFTGLHIFIDQDFEVLYPADSLSGYDEAQREWAQAIAGLTEQWRNKSPEEVASKLAWIESEAAFAHITYPRRTPAFCERLAREHANPAEIARHLLQLNGPPEVVEPFLKVATRYASEKDWMPLFQRCVESEPYQAIALSLAISTWDFPKELLDETLTLAPRFEQLIESACSAGSVSEKTLHQLLSSIDWRVALAAAIGLWCRAKRDLTP